MAENSARGFPDAKFTQAEQRRGDSRRNDKSSDYISSPVHSPVDESSHITYADGLELPPSTLAGAHALYYLACMVLG